MKKTNKSHSDSIIGATFPSVAEIKKFLDVNTSEILNSPQLEVPDNDDIKKFLNIENNPKKSKKYTKKP